MLKILLRILAFGLIGAGCAAVGLILGALIGGNFLEDFVFNGVRGYEATGQVGFFLGGLLGLLAGWRILFKRK